jgi:SAM-dependent methyltransferase
MRSRLESVRTYFDSDAARYGRQRYPAHPQTCEQYSYLVRREYVLHMLDRGASEPGLVLDIGCGPGVYTRPLLDRGWRVWGLDLSHRMLLVARNAASGSKAAFAVGQTTRLPFADGQVDAVICIGVMAYVESERLTVDEIVRVLRPGGCAVIQIANAWAPIRAEHRLRWEIRRRIRRGPADDEDLLRAKVRLTTQVPGQFLEACRAAGLQTRESRYYDFRMPFVTRLWPRGALAVGRALEGAAGSTLTRWWGAGFLARLEKTS